MDNIYYYIVAAVMLSVEVLWVFLIKRFIAKEYLCKYIFHSTNISARIFHFSILLNTLLGLFALWMYQTRSLQQFTLLWASLDLVATIIIPVFAVITAWGASNALLFFWDRMDKNVLETIPPLLNSVSDKNKYSDKRKESYECQKIILSNCAEIPKIRETIISLDSLLKSEGMATRASFEGKVLPIEETLATISANVKRLNDRNTEHDAEFTLRYVDVVKSLESLQGSPSISEQVLTPRGFHLCLSTDSGLVKLNQPHSFLFQAAQNIWAKRYKHFSREDHGPVYLFSGTSQQEKYNILDRVIRSSAERCFESIEKIQEKLDLKRSSVSIPNSKGKKNPYNQEFTYPRAIRLIVSSIDDLVDVLYDHYKRDFDGWILTGPSSRILNLWIPDEVRSNMFVTDWRAGKVVNSELFHTGLFGKDGRSINHDSASDTCNFNSILSGFIEAWESDIELRDDEDNIILDKNYFYASDIFTNDVKYKRRPGGFLSVGGICTMVGSRGEDTPDELNNSPWHRRAFLEVLPIVLMALHCKKALFFDWMYRLAIQDLHGETRGSKKEVIRQRLHDEL